MPQQTDVSTKLHPDDRNISEILRDLVNDVTRIVRDEVHLAQREFGEKLIVVRQAARALAAAAVAGLLAAACIATACVAALALVFPLWLAAILIGILLAVIAGGAY